MKTGYTDVPAGKIAAVVTHLEMCAGPDPLPTPAAQFDAQTKLVAVPAPDLDWYRDLFTRVGGQDWLWFSRLGMTDGELAGQIHDPKVSVFAVERAGRAEGLLELDFRESGACELGYFGLTSALIGGGVGRWLMQHAIAKAWGAGINRFHVHTCTLDSPQALQFYMRSGFTPYRRQIEIADDPRLTGDLPPDAAPQEPIL